MPTVPPRPAEPHRHRQVAESFGTDAERYDRTRPRYPAALVERIVSASPGRRVLDVGCGTGIAARQFQEAGCTVLGVEPDARMADLARRLGASVDVATFETWDPPAEKFDAVIAGQAWHWVDPVAGAAKAARVLRPGGRLAVFWNVPRLPSDLTEAVAAACERVMPEKPFDFQTMAKPALDAYAPILTKAADGIREAGGYDDPEQSRFTWEATYTRDEWLDQLPTFGIVTNLPPDKQAELLAEIRPAIDAMDDTFTLPYTTVAVTATRLRAPAA